MIKGIIFDFDGTLCTTHGLGWEAIKKATEKHDKTITKQKWDSFEGLNREERIRLAFPENASELIKAFNDFYENIFVERAEPLGDSIEALNLLTQKYKLFIFSTKYVELIKKGLQKFGIEKFFLEVLGRENLEKQKPNKEGIDFILKKYNLKKNEVVLVGDSVIDEESAKNAEIKFIQFFNPNNEKMSNSKYQKIQNHLELIDLLSEY